MHRDSTFSLAAYQGKKVLLDLVGGRQLSGTVKGMVDEQNNVILDEC